MKKNYLTISEISKLTNLPIRTLHYYDQIDLFKPAYVDPQTNYRYYNSEQIFQLDLIKSLKYIGTPLANIKQAQSLSPTQLLEFLSEQEQIVEHRIQRMLEIKQALLKTKKLLTDQINIPIYDEVYEKNITTQRLITLKVENLHVFNLPEQYFSSLAKALEREGAILSKYGGIYKFEDYETIDQIYFDYLFTPLLTERSVELLYEEENILVLSEGKYACIAFLLENEESYFDAYKKLYATVKAPLSPVYEVCTPINYSPIEPIDYIVELQVKIS